MNKTEMTQKWAAEANSHTLNQAAQMQHLHQIKIDQLENLATQIKQLEESAQWLENSFKKTAAQADQISKTFQNLDPKELMLDTAWWTAVAVGMAVGMALTILDLLFYPPKPLYYPKPQQVQQYQPPAPPVGNNSNVMRR